MAKLYYDNDADLSLLAGKTIAVIGYGSQPAHALNVFRVANLPKSGLKRMSMVARTSLNVAGRNMIC